MLWAACCLSFFGFLCTGEFTTNSLFDPSINLTVKDVQADYLLDPACFQFTSGARRHADPFCVDSDIYLPSCGPW